VFGIANVDAALAASVFHSGAIIISELKRELRAVGIEVRPAGNRSTAGDGSTAGGLPS
jgi:imidazole glycerol phosphate synthase subunit HisF